MAYDMIRESCNKIKAYPFAQNAVESLKSLADVFIVTAPLPRSKSWTYDREIWLREHFDIRLNHVIHARTKHLVHGNVFVDDKLSNVEEWGAYWEFHSRVPRIPFLWDQPWNANETLLHSKRAKSWDGIIDYVKGLVLWHYYPEIHLKSYPLTSETLLSEPHKPHKNLK